MAELTGSYVAIDESSMTTSKSSVQQLIDIVQSDISNLGGENTRKKYQVFVSGGTNLTSITSSLYQTVFDQDFTLGTSNPLFDITVGSFLGGTSDVPTVNTVTAEFDGSGKLLFKNGDGTNNNSLQMMREKVSIYRQFAQTLLGDANSSFITPHGATPAASPTPGELASGTTAKIIDGAIFISFKRLFTRDNIFKGSFGLKFFKNAAVLTETAREQNLGVSADDEVANTSDLIDDTLSNTNLSIDPVCGEVSTLRLSVDGSHVGLIYYDKGIIVLDAERAVDNTQFLRGLITSTSTNTDVIPIATAVGGETPAFALQITPAEGQSLFRGRFYPELWVSGTIDQVIDHVCDSRFGDGELSAIGFRNETIINSSLIFCRAAPSQLNYSTNPTYKKSNGDIIALNGSEPFSFITTVGLYDESGFLLAVAKTSRPIEKNPQTDLSIRIRLDY
jgi:hypothetical protein